MKLWTIHFRVIDHSNDDSCAPNESTMLRADTLKDALDIFYSNMVGFSVMVLDVVLTDE